MDDDCQTDSEQIKLAINKSKTQVVNSLKRIKKEKLIYGMINGQNDDEEEEESFYFSSQESFPSKNSSSSYGFKFSKESQFL